jgi:LCP family protein required for cell wall assembly
MDSRWGDFKLSARVCASRLAAIVVMAGLILAACARPAAVPTLTASASPTHPQPTETATPSPSSSPAGTQPVWDGFPGPTLPAATEIPPPFPAFNLDADTHVAVFMGSDEESPYRGLTQAIELVLYNTRLAKAAMIAIPPELYVYLPGFSMQRINAAYAVGDVAMVVRTFQYNFGLRPDHWVIAHPSDLIRVVDDLHGVAVTVLQPLPNDCGGISGGTVVMMGQQAFCYARLVDAQNPFARIYRQQELAAAIFWRLVHGGTLVRLPDLFALYAPNLVNNFTLGQLMDDIPLALKLGDPGRIAYLALGKSEVSTWQLSANAEVFLPDRKAVAEVLQRAIDSVQSPAPLSEQVATLEYELTVSPTATATPTATDTFTPTPSPRPTITRTPTPIPTYTPSKIPSLTPSRTPTPTLSPTVTGTPTPPPTETPSPAP